MKKTISTILIAILSLSCFTIVSNAISFSVYLNPNAKSVAPGGTIDVYLTAGDLNVGENGMNVFSCILKYDRGIFEELTSDDITSLNNWKVTFNPDKEKLLLDNTNFVNQESELCKITFTVKSTITEGKGEISVSEPITSNGKIDITGTSQPITISVSKVTSNTYQINADNTITGVTPETTLSDLKSAINGIEGAIIKDKKGNVITSTTTKIGTGTTIAVPGGETYTVVVKGDINGDGEIGPSDLSKLSRHYLEIEALDKIYVTAGDILTDGKITLTDISRLKQAIVGIITL